MTLSTLSRVFVPGGAIFPAQWCFGVVFWYCAHRRVPGGPTEGGTQTLPPTRLAQHVLSQENDGTGYHWHPANSFLQAFHSYMTCLFVIRDCL